MKLYKLTIDFIVPAPGLISSNYINSRETKREMLFTSKEAADAKFKEFWESIKPWNINEYFQAQVTEQATHD